MTGSHIRGRLHIRFVVVPFFYDFFKEGIKGMRDINDIHSDITGKDYYPQDGVRIVNVRQATLYLKHGCELLDLYISVDFNTGDPILCFIFNREQSKKYFDLWCKHELT